MPLSLVQRVPSTSRCLFEIDEEVDPGGADARQSMPTIAGYEILEHLGAGSSGSDVFAAQRTSDSKQVAIKVLRKKFAGRQSCALPRFVRESKLTCKISNLSPHLSNGLDWGCADGDFYLVMKLLRGKSLDALLLDRGRLEWAESTRIALHVARALCVLHAQKIVHRDVKPENVIVTDEDERVTTITMGEHIMGVLIDLGLARPSGEDADEEVEPLKAGDEKSSMMHRVKTPAFSAIGSPAFMAPEQVRDAHEASYAADVYGLGATWYAAVTGVLPFTGSSPAKVMAQVMSGEVLPPSARVPNLPPAVDAMIVWLLQKDPRDRPPCGQALVDEIQAVIERPGDVRRVLRARKAMARKWQWEDRVNRCLRLLAGLVAGALLAWLTWETLQAMPEQQMTEPPNLLPHQQLEQAAGSAEAGAVGAASLAVAKDEVFLAFGASPY